MRTTLNLDDFLISQAKQRAARRGMTLTALIEDALARVLCEPDAPAAPFRVRVFEGAAPFPVDPADEDAMEAHLAATERRL